MKLRIFNKKKIFKNIKIKKLNVKIFNNIKLRIKLFLMSLLPLVILGVVTLGTFTTTYINSAVTQTEEDLYAISATILSAYEQNSGKYFYASNDNLWKGSYNISLSKIMLEDIKMRTDNDITIVRFDNISKDDPTKEIVASTAVDEETGEILFDEGTKITKEIADQIQDAGAKMIHLAPHTKSNIISKSIASNGGNATYRGTVKISKKVAKSKQKRLPSK